MNTHVTVTNIHQDVLKIREEIGGQVRPVSTSRIDPSIKVGCLQLLRSKKGQKLRLPMNPAPYFVSSLHGEPPPPPRACFGRDNLIEKIVSLAENLTPIALIGPGGIGKTSLALAVLHHYRIERRFRGNRWFIRCDQFTPSHTHFLNRLSKVIGAGVENPKDLTSLRSFLSSKKMIIVLDNAESILDPRGMDAPEIYAIVEELSQFKNISLCITSRISTIPPNCETLEIPTLLTEAARDTFYSIYKSSRQSNRVNGILKQLDFHPLSITLLATVAQHNKWDANRLTREWERRRIDVLHTQYNRSLATTIELSLASPMFQELGPDARELLGVIAFFPQGIDENNLEWLFPTISNRTSTFDSFCILSLAYRNNGFFTMLAPLRDYLRPRDPKSSPLLCRTKKRYFSRLSVHVNPGNPGFEEARWITSEDVNLEHLLDVFTSIDANSGDVWDACTYFMRHLYWHKPRLVVLGPKIEGLPDVHHSKPECLFQLSRLFDSVGNRVEYKRFLVHTLKIWKERGNDVQVARTLKFLSNANTELGLYKEGIQQVKEASEIYKRLNDISGQAQCSQQLAKLLYGDKQLDAAEETASQAIDLLEGGNQFTVCKCYGLLGRICHSRGETEKAIKHFETALGIASTFNWRGRLSAINCGLAELFCGENRFDEAHARVGLAKSHAINDSYQLGHAMTLQASVWYKERRLEEAKSEVLRAVGVFEKLGATRGLEKCSNLLRCIEKEMKMPVTSGKSLETLLFPAPANSPFSGRRPRHTRRIPRRGVNPTSGRISHSRPSYSSSSLLPPSLFPQ